MSDSPIKNKNNIKTENELYFISEETKNSMEELQNEVKKLDSLDIKTREKEKEKEIIKNKQQINNIISIMLDTNLSINERIKRIGGASANTETVKSFKKFLINFAKKNKEKIEKIEKNKNNKKLYGFFEGILNIKPQDFTLNGFLKTLQEEFSNNNEKEIEKNKEKINIEKNKNKSKKNQNFDIKINSYSLSDKIKSLNIKSTKLNNKKLLNLNDKILQNFKNKHPNNSILNINNTFKSNGLNSLKNISNEIKNDDKFQTQLLNNKTIEKDNSIIK